MADTFAVTQLQPLPGYVIVAPAEVEKQTASGIYLPDSHEEKPLYGTVLAVGADTVIDGAIIACPVKKGAKVIYKKWGGNELKIGDVEYQILKFEDLLAQISK